MLSFYNITTVLSKCLLILTWPYCYLIKQAEEQSMISLQIFL